ncbi:MAG: MFS transporter [Planctomycetes bacterium]|nr:MFS transporter [Planctomycetota bacterium]
MSAHESPPTKSPWSFVPTLYTNQGLAYFVVQAATTTYFKILGVPVADIGRYASDLTLPWMLKPLWSPLIDLFGTKRGWLILSAVATSLAIAALAWAIQGPDPVTHVALACLMIAVAGASNDIATDGFYILALTKHDQEFFVGARSAAFRIGRIAVMGGAIGIAGWLKAGDDGNTAHAWSLAFGACALVYALSTVWHFAALPRPSNDAPTRRSGIGWNDFVESLQAYFARPGIVGGIAFILLFRLGESLLTPMLAPFLLTERAKDGVGLNELDVAFIYGTVGVVALVAGGILGGMWIARVGLKRALLPCALALHVPNLLYAWAATAHFERSAITAVIGVEQFGYGLGFSAYMAALLALSRGTRFSTTHYAISTGIMALSAWLAGRYSGDMVEWLGFGRFFWVVCTLGVVGLATLPFFPHEDSQASARPITG